MNEVKCPKCNKKAGEARGKYELVSDDYDLQIQCRNSKCKTKINIKLERL